MTANSFFGDYPDDVMVTDPPHRSACRHCCPQHDALRAERDKFKQAFLEGSDKVVALRAEAKALSNQIAVTNVELADAMHERDALLAAIEQTWRPEVAALRARIETLSQS